MTGKTPSVLEPELPTSGLAGSFIDGRWHSPANDDVIRIENPSRRSELTAIGKAQASEIDLAVNAAQRAFATWKQTSASERGNMLGELGRRVAQHGEQLARLLAAETGNALRTQARGEAAGAAAVLAYYAGVSVEQKGETLPLGPQLFSYTTREPVGVVGAIIPWNAPLQLATVKISMALAIGNTLVLKPAEDAPLAVLRMIELAADIFPKGVLNVVTGLGEQAGAALVNHPGVRKLSFTGSSEVGRFVAHGGADRIARITLELGGKSPCIVMPDAIDDDAEQIANGIINAMRFARQGQSCTAGSRLFLHEAIWSEVMPKVIEGVNSMKLGDALDETSDIGAIINAERYQEIRNYVLEAQQQGAEFLCGDVPVPLSEAGGYFPLPTILSGLDNNWRIAVEEVFGPVLVALPWSDESQVISMANDTHYGLAAFVFGKDISAVHRVCQQLDAGWIQVNQGGGQIPGMSYGGTKQSGIGSEYSIEGALEAYTFRKSVTMAVQTP